jgi:hypothetical protein
VNPDLGGILEVYSALPPWGDKLPVDVDEKQYEECKLLVDHLRSLSEQCAYEFEFYLDDVYVGSVSNGAMDKLLTQGLFEEWRKVLDSRKKQ